MFHRRGVALEQGKECSSLEERGWLRVLPGLGLTLKNPSRPAPVVHWDLGPSHLGDSGSFRVSVHLSFMAAVLILLEGTWTLTPPSLLFRPSTGM